MQICDICGEKLSKRERKGSIKRCADCWEMSVRWARACEQDSVEWNKLQRKLAKVKAERDALETKMADMERDRDLWRADANALRDRWMAAVQENQMLQERLDKTMAEVEALQRDWCEWFKPKEHPSCDNAPASTLTSPKS
jgi:chromosome segregation ATPase